jgi:hypothetical protein
MYIYDNDVPAAGTFPWSTCGVYIPCIVLWRVEEAKRKRRYVRLDRAVSSLRLRINGPLKLK